MRIKVFMVAIAAGVLVGFGVLAGSVMGSTRAAAQSATPQSTTAPKTDATPVAPANPGRGIPGGPGPHGGFGPGGRGGHGDFGPGGFGPFGGATAEGATREISNTTSLITLVKSDLAYANSKMDTADVQRWVDGADALLAKAHAANSSGQYGQAAGYARAASELARVADLQMAQKLGASTLPSYSQRPQRDGHMDPNATGSATASIQAHVSRILQGTYNRLVTQGALLKSAANAGDAATYLTDAQNAYKAAYTAYQAGNYTDAAASARLAEELAEVSNAILQAVGAPADSTTPVTVPAPNFQ
jgi:hypothetical protein